MVWDLEQLRSDSLHERGVATSQPPARASVEDPVLPHLIAWLASEFGLGDIPLLAAQYPCSDHLNPHRGQLAVLASEKIGGAAQRVPGTEWNGQVSKAAADYMQFAGYQADGTGMAIAACDYYFGRIRDGFTDPVVGAACIAFLSGSLRERLEPDWLRQIHRRCSDLIEPLYRNPSPATETQIEVGDLVEVWFGKYAARASNDPASR